MNKPHKHSEVIKAWADGAEIECRCPVSNSGWSPTNAPFWLEDYEYRVKPQPKKYKVDVWLVFRKDGTFITDFTSQPDVAMLPSSNYHVIPHTLEGELPNV